MTWALVKLHFHDTDRIEAHYWFATLDMPYRNKCSTHAVRTAIKGGGSKGSLRRLLRLLRHPWFEPDYRDAHGGTPLSVLLAMGREDHLTSFLTKSKPTLNDSDRGLIVARFPNLETIAASLAAAQSANAALAEIQELCD